MLAHQRGPNQIAYSRRATWLQLKLNAPSTQVKLHDAIVAVQPAPEAPLPASLFSTNGIFPTDVSWNSLWFAARPSRKLNCSRPADITPSPSIFTTTPR